MDGFRGVQVNFLREGQGLAPVFGLKIPLGILLLTGIIFSILDIVGVEKPKSLGNKYLRSGIFFAVIVIVLVVFISQLASTLPALAASVGADLPPEANQIAETIARQPLMGETTSAVGDFGSVYLNWGLAIGAYMFVLAAVTKIVSGIYLRLTPEPKGSPATVQETQEKKAKQ
jgi:Na+-transporting methylmalonyl-CoA/oxaloacetate decarboxylase gamma subunit